MPIVRAAVVGGVLALAIVSVMFAGLGASAVPYWLQGLFAICGIAGGGVWGAVRAAAAA